MQTLIYKPHFPRKKINEVRDESDKVYDPSFDADAASSIAFYTTNMLPR